MDVSTREATVKTGDIVEGRYRIIKTLADGGMGTVFLAEHVLIKRRVAIKILHSDLATDTEVIERFMNEALAAGTLGHPNIVESTDMGFTRNDVPYIVFEYLEGTLLTDEIYRVGGLPIRRALRIAEQIASALDAAHNANIIHRDLKSDNVFLTDREDALDHVKVLDFGISRFLEGDHDNSRRGMVMGTPEFMAPEQITSPEHVDKRADIYALGVVLYEMLSARRPFRKTEGPGGTRPRINTTQSDVDNSHALMHRIVHDTPPPLTLGEDAPAGLVEMVFEKLLTKDPEKRYQSMKMVQGALEAFHGVMRQSRPSGSMPPLNIPAATPTPFLNIDSEPVHHAVGSSAIASTASVPEARAVPVSLPPKRRSSTGWLIAALVAGAAGGGTFYMQTQERAKVNDNHEIKAKLDADADKLAAAFDQVASAAHLRADGIATTPMLRSAIETDAATLKDMAGNDFIFTPAKGERLELFQIKNGAPKSLLRIPAGAAPLAPITGSQTRIDRDGDTVVIVASAPVTRMTSGVGGSLAIAMTVDLEPIKHKIADHVIGASLVGMGQPIVLAKPTAEGLPMSVPVTTGQVKAGDLSLAVVIAAPPPPSTTYLLASFACWGFAGLLLLIYVISLLKGRSRG